MAWICRFVRPSGSFVALASSQDLEYTASSIRGILASTSLVKVALIQRINESMGSWQDIMICTVLERQDRSTIAYLGVYGQFTASSIMVRTYGTEV